MSDRSFQMRLQCRYEGEENHVSTLSVEHRVEGEWVPFELGLQTPGFEIFLYAVLTCQHTYFRVNCAERGVRLSHAEGGIEVGATQDWTLDALTVAFDGHLAAGRAPEAGVAEAIAARMQQCPVSHNLRPVPGAATRVRFD